jgi:hypothetical protein
MKNNELLNKYFDFFTDEVIEEVKVDEIKEVVVNTVTKSQKRPTMSEEAFDEFFKDIYADLNK